MSRGISYILEAFLHADANTLEPRKFNRVYELLRAAGVPEIQEPAGVLA